MLQMFRGFEVNFFALLMLIGLYITISIRERVISTSNRLFVRLIWLTCFMLVIEILGWHVDYKLGRSWWFVNYILSFLYVWLSPLAVTLWLSYIDYHIFHDYKRLKERYFYIHPMIFSTILLVVNFFVPIVFEIDGSNQYVRKPFIWLLVFTAYASVIYLARLLHKNRDLVKTELVMTMLALIMVPALAAAFQVILDTKSLSWTSTTLVLVITFIFLETVSTSRDYLTGLSSRNMVDDVIEYKIQMQQPFWVIMIDLDDFKSINDTYGHLTGDHVLQIFGKVLEDALPNNMIKARYGGDEFLVVAKGAMGGGDISDYRRRIKGAIIHYEKLDNLPFKFAFSMGSQAYKKGMTYQELMGLADKKMYEMKARK